MKKYDSYKNSGIEWLGEIPNHWKVTKLKFIGDAIGGLTYAPNNVVENESQGVLVLRSSNIQNGKLSLNDNVFVNLEISEKLTLKKGDILICSRNGSQHLIGKNICIDERTEGSTFGAFMMIFRSKNYGFLNQYFNSPIFTSQSGLFLTATINQLTSGTLNNFYIAIPETIEEQTAIANYLDHKTTQIDTLIAKKEQFINLLQEERIAVINQAVTKGLDPKVKMKDSGIEWLGEIPEHWEVKKLKYCLKIQSGKGITNEELKPDGEFAVYGGNGIMGYTDKYSSEGIDLIIGRVGALCGNVHLIVDKKWISDNALFARTDENEYFMEYFLRFLDLNRLANKNAQPLITGTMVKEQFICLPIIEEQLNIVSYVRNQHLRIDTLLSKTHQEIELLKEYKTALISEVVTGKVDVRGEIVN